MRFKIIPQTPELILFLAETITELPLLFVDSGISAGFPSPADDYLEVSLDLNKELISNPSSTFYGRVRGDSMQEDGIHEGDVLIIDKSLEPRNNALAVCYIDGEFTVKRLRRNREGLWLMPANPRFSPIRVTVENDFCVWGIVTYVIKKTA
jgi:DNA polymerase V